MSNLYFWNDNKKESEINGVSFEGITSDWTSEFTVGIKTDSEKGIEVKSFCGIIQDDYNLAEYLKIRIEIKENNIPVFLSSSYSFTEWAKNGISLGTLNNKTDKVITLLFSCDKLPERKQGKSSHFDFEFSTYEYFL